MTCPPKHGVRRWTLRDWRDADPALLRACYDTEQHHWRRELAWDTTWTWSTIEQARVTWGLPGLLALDAAGSLHGWTFYMRRGGVLDVGGLVASDESTTRALVDAILDAAVRQEAEGVSFFVLERAPGLDAALSAHGVEVERFLYLSRPLSNAASVRLRRAAASAGRPDVTELASLLHASYSPGAARHFAPNGTIGEWIRYVDGLIRQRGCGVFDPSATCFVRDARGLAAATLVTSIAATTAHLAQLAVRPDVRGRGLAEALIRDACERAANAGKTHMTLLVGEHNAVARRLYDSMGFAVQAGFTAAWCGSGSLVANGDLSAAYGARA